MTLFCLKESAFRAALIQEAKKTLAMLTASEKTAAAAVTAEEGEAAAAAAEVGAAAVTVEEAATVGTAAVATTVAAVVGCGYAGLPRPGTLGLYCEAGRAPAILRDCESSKCMGTGKAHHMCSYRARAHSLQAKKVDKEDWDELQVFCSPECAQKP